MTRASVFQLKSTEARGHAVLAASVAWCILLFSLTGAGSHSRFGPLKWADFAHFYTLGHIARTGPPGALYDSAAQHSIQASLVPESAGETFRIAYPPLLALFFSPFSLAPYVVAGALWAAVSIGLLLGCVAIVRRRLRRPYDAALTHAMVLAFPPTWALIGYGQTTAVLVVSFVLAWLALQSNRRFLAGVALGGLMIKPQFGLVLAVAAVACAEWRLIAGVCLSIGAQLLLSTVLFGRAVVAMYLSTLARVASTAMAAEDKPQMQHSLRVLVDLAPDWYSPVLLTIASGAVIYGVVRVWRRSDDPRLRMGVLILGSVLVNPHLYLYDASVLVLSALWLGDVFVDENRWFWHRAYALAILLLMPTAGLIRIQLSVVVMLELMYQITRRAVQANASPFAVSGHTALQKAGPTS